MTTYSDPENNSTKTPPENSERRLVLKKLAIGTAAVAGCSVIPNKWTSPLVEFGALPAHAVTSGATAFAQNTAAELSTPTVVEPTTTAAPVAVAPTASVTEKGTYWGRHNGNRPTWYFSKTMRSYPDQFTISVDGCGSVTVNSNNGTRFTQGSFIVKQSDVTGRGMALIASAGCYSRTASVTY